MSDLIVKLGLAILGWITIGIIVFFIIKNTFVL